MVQGLRSGNKVKTKVINRASKKVLQGNIKENMQTKSKVITDEAMHYHTMDKIKGLNILHCIMRLMNMSKTAYLLMTWKVSGL